MSQAVGLVRLCPWWSRYFQRGDGKWMAYCSKAACDQMEQDRPGWKERVEGEFSEKCLYGFDEDNASLQPIILVRGSLDYGAWGQIAAREWAIHLIKHGLVTAPRPDVMTDALWQQYIDAFMEWEP